jgi:hypothetical protein
VTHRCCRGVRDAMGRDAMLLDAWGWEDTTHGTSGRDERGWRVECARENWLLRWPDTESDS